MVVVVAVVVEVVREPVVLVVVLVLDDELVMVVVELLVKVVDEREVVELVFVVEVLVLVQPTQNLSLYDKLAFGKCMSKVTSAPEQLTT